MRPMPGLPVAGTAGAADVRPRLSLTLLSAQHALIHAQSALLPLIFLEIIDEFGVGVDDVGYLVALGSLVSGAIQLWYGALTRVVSRPAILGVGGLVFGGGMAAMAATTSWVPFSVATIVSRLGGSPQHPVGNALLAEQFRPERRSLAISVHIAIGNLGTVAIPVVGGWVIATARWPAAALAVALPAVVVGLAILLFVREGGTDREAAIAHGTTFQALRSLRSERQLLWLFAASSVAAAGRGLGLVSTFVPLYLSLVLGLDTGTVAWMYMLLLVGSVPGPIVAGWLAERLGHRPVLIVTYVAGAASLALFPLAGENIPLVLVAIGFMSAFVFEESSLLQALLAEVTPPRIRDVAFSGYFTLMFGIGAAWAAVLGALVGALGNEAGFPVTFFIMATSYLIAAAVVSRVHEPGDRRGGPGREPGTELAHG